jgi:hypothetical protein
MVLEQLDIHIQKNEFEPYLTPYIKTNSKYIKSVETVLGMGGGEDKRE